MYNKILEMSLLQEALYTSKILQLKNIFLLLMYIQKD